MRKKLLHAMLLLSFIAAFILPTFVSVSFQIRADTYLARPDKPPKPPKPTKTSVDIRSIPSGDTVYRDVLVIAEAAGTFDVVVYQIDSGSEYSMSRVGSTERFHASWDTTTVSAGMHTVTVKAKDSVGTAVASDAVEVTVVTSFQWELYYEIDYMSGHEPSQAVLDYLAGYWEGHAVKVWFLINDTVSDPTPGDGYISSTDFWAIEYNSNDVWMYDDRSFGGADPKYTLPEKWMLYGTWDENSNVGGYTYVTLDGKDCLGGNYIFIADAMIDNWEGANSIPDDGGEVIVVGHEAGHSAGVAVVRGRSEKYDPDVYSIMSYMRLENAKHIAPCWYYSKEYWSTANLDYYG